MERNDTKMIQYGYLCKFKGTRVFVLASNIAETLDKLQEYTKDSNFDYSLESHCSIPILR